MLQEAISSPPELAPPEFLLSPFAGISRRLAKRHRSRFLIPSKHKCSYTQRLINKEEKIAYKAHQKSTEAKG